MSCREMNALMSPYLDGLLNGDQTRRLEYHIVSCNECRYKIQLMKEIPLALQTDRMLVPRPEFTAMVMQKIVITSQFQSDGKVQTAVRTETRYTFRNTEEHTLEKITPQNDLKILTLPRREVSLPRPIKSPGVYLLRFSSLAAALVLAVGVGIYSLQISASGASASTSEGIALFARTLIEAFQSPAEVLLGVVITVALVIVLWFVFRTNDRNEQFSSAELNQRRNLE
jgi:hypothetical protein